MHRVCGYTALASGVDSQISILAYIDTLARMPQAFLITMKERKLALIFI